MHGVSMAPPLASHAVRSNVHALGCELVDAAANHLVHVFGRQIIASSKLHHDLTQHVCWMRASDTASLAANC